jgi:hypothetical protein
MKYRRYVPDVPDYVPGINMIGNMILPEVEGVYVPDVPDVPDENKREVKSKSILAVQALLVPLAPSAYPQTPSYTQNIGNIGNIGNIPEVEVFPITEKLEQDREQDREHIVTDAEWQRIKAKYGEIKSVATLPPLPPELWQTELSPHESWVLHEQLRQQYQAKRGIDSRGYYVVSSV